MFHFLLFAVYGKDSCSKAHLNLLRERSEFKSHIDESLPFLLVEQDLQRPEHEAPRELQVYDGVIVQPLLKLHARSSPLVLHVAKETELRLPESLKRCTKRNLMPFTSAVILHRSTQCI